VLKPNKDKRYPENYRGITVANTLSTDVSLQYSAALVTMKAVFREDDFSVNPHCNLL
jgi:hypothetical protein